MARGFQIVSGGTDNHLMLVDLRNKGLTGKVAEQALDRAGITVNKNTVPKETQSPFVTSGIRIGTPAVTTRGMKEAGDAAHRGADRYDAAGAGGCGVAERVRSEVRELAAAFPLYPAPVDDVALTHRCRRRAVPNGCGAVSVSTRADVRSDCARRHRCWLGVSNRHAPAGWRHARGRHAAASSCPALAVTRHRSEAGSCATPARHTS